MKKNVEMWSRKGARKEKFQKQQKGVSRGVGKSPSYPMVGNKI